MRLWLGAAFALVTLITAASVYVFVDDSSGRTLQSQSADLAVGKTSSLADDLGKADKLHAANVLAEANTGNFEVWAVNRHGNALRARPGPGRRWPPSRRSGEAVRVALDNRRYSASLPGNVTVAAAPIFGKTQGERRRGGPGRAAACADPRVRPAARRPAAGAPDRDRDRGAGRLPGLLADRDPGAAAGPAPRRRWRPGNFDVPAAARGQRRDRRPDPIPGLDAGGAPQDVQPARHRARPPLGDLRRADRGGDRGRRGRRGSLHESRRRPPGPGRAARHRADPVAAARGRAAAPPRSPCSGSTAASTASRRAAFPPSTRCCSWSATAPTSSSARRPSASSSPTPRTSFATRSPGSRAGSRCCAAAPRTTRTPATASSTRLAVDAERMTRLTQSLLTLARVEAAGEQR